MLTFLIIWPERDALRKNLPNSFSKYKNYTAIIDCTEIYIKRPLNLQAPTQTSPSLIIKTPTPSNI